MADSEVPKFFTDTASESDYDSESESQDDNSESEMNLDSDGNTSSEESSSNDEDSNREIYKFKWRKGVNITPEETEYAFGVSRINPSFHIPISATPLQIFQRFLTQTTQNNRYVSQIQTKKPQALNGWKSLVAAEFWNFMALRILMGIVKKPSTKDYWSTEQMIATPFFNKVMSRNRFEDIQRSLNFVDNENNPDLEADRYTKLGNVFDRVIQSVQECIIAGQYLSVDEELMLFKGRISFKQYIPKKRARFGLKLFVLVDCESKIVLNVIPYQGKKTKFTESVNQFGVGGAAVHSPIESHIGDILCVRTYMYIFSLSLILKD